MDKVRIETSPHDAQLHLEVGLSRNDRRDGRNPVEYNDIMRCFAQFESRLPKEPPPQRSG